MAYAAVVSLKNTIRQFLNTNPIFNVSSSTQETMEFALKEMESLQQLLQKLDNSSVMSNSRKRLDALDEKMREEVYKLEDVLDFHESESCENYGSDDEKVKQEISRTLVVLKKMEEGYTEELHDPLCDDEEEEEEEYKYTDSLGDPYFFNLGEEEEEEDDDEYYKKKMVLTTDDMRVTKNHVLRKMKRPDDFGVLSFVGRVGSGRTIFAKGIYDDLYVRQEEAFECGAWVSVGPKYEFNDILINILTQIKAEEEKFDEKNIGEYLHANLKGKRFIVVLDDVCDSEVWDYMRSSFPVEDNGSIIILTTALEEVALSAQSFFIYPMGELADTLVWSLLCPLIFEGEEACPPSFEEAGIKIAKNCQGLQISFAKVALHLSQSHTKTPEYWKEFAQDKANPIYIVEDEITEMCATKQVYYSTQDEVEKYAVELGEVIINATPETFDSIKRVMFPKTLFPKMEIVCLCGMAGIGKTTVADVIFRHPTTWFQFNHRVWISLGQKYVSEDILVDILAQIHPDIDKTYLKFDMKLVQDLCMELSNKKCLIVMDDMWSTEPLQCLKKLFPNIKGDALVTTRLHKILMCFGDNDRVQKMDLLCEEESWHLFCSKVFGRDPSCPSELNKAAKKIVKKCDGLPLMIVKVAEVLNKSEKTPDFWNAVAEEENLVFKEVRNGISKSLLLSYHNLPQHLRACLLYMGVFPLDYEIPRAKLAMLWAAEGFLERNISPNPKDPFSECLLDFDNRNVVLVPQKGSYFRIKACRLHSVYWHLCNDLATENKLFHGFTSFAKSSIQGIKSQRRLCIRNNTLLGIKQVFNSIETLNSTARSLLCTGPYHKYQVPIFFGLSLLKVVDALTIRFYGFPVQVLELFRLRYLALTCNGMLPSSISKLWNLQILIVRKHLSIKYPGSHFYLPVEIWDMKNLKHLQIMGSNLPNPTLCGVDLILPNLVTLSDVSAHNFTKRILKRIRNLKKLGIRIELSLDDDGKQFHCLNRISRLKKLESLTCVVVNPKLMYKVNVAPRSMFPSSLRKLHLSGLGYPWEYMSIIGSLPKLEVLKLTCYAFRGPIWEPMVYATSFGFQKLKFLSIEDSDLASWKAKTFDFPLLNHLSIIHCFILQELPSFSDLDMIEVIDCNPSVANWAKKIEEKSLKRPFAREYYKVVRVQSSWM